MVKKWWTILQRKNEKKELQRKRKEKQKIRDREKEENEPPVVKEISEEEFMGSVKAFEEKNKSLTYKRCTGCKKVQLGLKIFNVTVGNTNHWLCSMCKSPVSFLDKMKCALPIWFDVNGKKHFELPEELKDLTEEEKLLIQIKMLTCLFITCSKDKPVVKVTVQLLDKI